VRLSVARAVPLRTASAEDPIAVCAYFDVATAPQLLAALARRVPARARRFVGTYGQNSELALEIHDSANTFYAPMFSLRTTYYWERRRLFVGGGVDREILHADRFAGALPSLDAIETRSKTVRLGWGLELGRRYRDAIRNHNRAHRRASERVDTWQFDEIRSECADAKPLREFTRAVLRGLLLGRTEQGDEPMRGIVWMAQRAFRAVDRRLDDELALFWKRIDQASFALVGEEYPAFVGDAARAARTYGLGHRRLAAAGPVRRSLASKYVVGLTPGYRVDRKLGLGGNVQRWPRVQVNEWRSGYLDERRGARPAGVAFFDLTHENAGPAVLRDVASTLRRVAR
jgi:hypothetical protein